MASCHRHGKNELTKRVGLQECRGAWKNRRGEKRETEWKKNKKKGKRKGEERRERRGKKVRPSKQNQMQECGGSFDLGPHRLIDVAHFISLSES